MNMYTKTGAFFLPPPLGAQLKPARAAETRSFFTHIEARQLRNPLSKAGFIAASFRRVEAPKRLHGYTSVKYTP